MDLLITDMDLAITYLNIVPHDTETSQRNRHHARKVYEIIAQFLSNLSTADERRILDEKLSELKRHLVAAGEFAE